MISLTADDAMLAMLHQVKELAEIRDSSGTVVGFFAPVALRDAQSYARAAAHIDPAEIRRRQESKEPCYTTKEVFEHLKSLAPDLATQGYLQGLIDEVAERDKCSPP
jgi:hypothetical protein